MSLKAFVCCIWMIASSALSAHQSAFSYLELNEHDDGTVRVVFKKPLQDRDVTDLKIEFSRHCYDVTLQQQRETKGYLVTKRTLKCNHTTLVGSSIRVRHLLPSDVGVIFHYETQGYPAQNRLITAENPYVLIGNNQTFWRNAFDYLWLGVEHILIGFDHLMFVFVLLLLVHSVPRLIQTITAFTVAHSITLGLATLGVIHISVSYIEAMIALSIVFVARELLLDLHVKTLARSYPWAIAFLFGLLHGFGFASVLSAIGLDSERIWSSLLFFNVGVELGQLGFIAVILLLFELLKRTVPAQVEPIKHVAVYAIGITASYWFLQRLVV